jgi:dUTP pyrophosphatase
MDLFAAVTEDLLLAPGERAMVSTGIRIAIPEGYEAQVRPRSGLARRYGLGMVNAPGTIDSDYRGIVAVLLINWGSEPIVVHRGDRIAQMVVSPIVRVEWEMSSDQPLPETSRHEGGFGHTGVG